MLESLDKNRLAELCGKALFSHDSASAALGIKIVEVTPGHATASMEVRPDMVNGFDICHGGLVFTLNEELRPIYKDWGIDFPPTYGDSTFELPMPATYVVDQKARIVLSFVDVDYTKRLEPSEILDALKAIAA